jgi:hypothetical protein
MLYQIGGVLPILMARAAMRPAAALSGTKSKLEVRAPEAASILRRDGIFPAGSQGRVRRIQAG